MRKSLTIVCAFALALLIPLSCALIAPPAPAPDFTLTDIDGNSWTLSDYIGHRVLIDCFFTSWAGCVAAIPELKDVRDHFAGTDLVMIGISVFGIDTEAGLQAFRTTHTITWPLAIDVGDVVRTAYDITGAPSVILIDPDGWVQYAHLGDPGSATLISELETIAPPAVAPTIESCDSTGAKKDTFQLSDEVYASGTGYSASTTYDIYLVEDVTWVDGLAIPARVPGTTTSISSDSTGNVPATLLWSNPLTPGNYDIVVDIDGDGLYSEQIDALDDNDIEVTAGFFVIPENLAGTILGLIVCFAAFGMFRAYKPKRL